MNKCKAIRTLKKQLKSADSTNSHYLLYVETVSYLEEIFGKESLEYKRFSYLKIPDITNAKFDEQLSILKREISSFIQIVKIKGVKRNGNYLSRLSDTWLTAILFTSLTAAFGIGRWMGVRESLPLQSTDYIPKNNATSNEKKIRDTTQNKIHTDTIKIKK